MVIIFFAIPHALGPLDLAQDNVADMPGVIITGSFAEAAAALQ